VAGAIDGTSSSGQNPALGAAAIAIHLDPERAVAAWPHAPDKLRIGFQERRLSSL